MQVQDDLYLGPEYFNRVTTAADNPTSQPGCGPMGRIVFRNILPLTLQTNNAAALQALTAATAMTLAIGTGTTLGTAPNGSGSSVIMFDVARAVSLTSTANLSAINVTIVGFDEYGQRMTQTRAGPNNNTVNTLKAFKSVLSVTPDTTSASTMSVGTSDVIGLNFCMTDVVYLMAVKWAATLAQDAGTFVAADTTSPATAATGDVRGTYVPSSASNGARRLVVGMHLSGAQCGWNATEAAAFGVTQA